MNSPSSGRDQDAAVSDTCPKLSPSALGVHNRSIQRRHSRQVFVSEWVASQSEVPASETAPSTPGSARNELQRQLPPATPAIVLTTPNQNESDATELLAAKLRSPNTLPRPSGAAAKTLQAPHSGLALPGSSSLGLETASSPGIPGGGCRRLSLYPVAGTSVSLIDKPILEVEDEEYSDGSEASTHQASVTMPAKAGGREALAHMYSEHGEVQIDEPNTEEQMPLSRARKRAMSYPSEGSHQKLPLLELPYHDAQQDQTDVRTDTIETTQTPPPPPGIGKFAQVALMAKKWKKRSSTVDQPWENSREALVNRQKKRPYTEIPRALRLDLLEEAYPIVQKTHQMYKYQLGPRHKLTLLAEKHLKNLATQLGK